MQLIELKNSVYGFTKDFKHDQKIRASFNTLTETVFGFSLENWYLRGYWRANYIPYSLLHKNKVISNVSVNNMELIIGNEKKVGIQIGTVITDKDYRNKGLNKFILEQVVKDWNEKSDFIYLFANDSVLDFYPKFNFKRVDEYQCSKTLRISYTSAPSFKKLDTANKNDIELLEKTINDAQPISKIAMRNNTSLIMFYCLSFKKDCIYYLKEIDAVVIAEIEGETLYLNDVFSKDQVDLNQVIQQMANKTTKKVTLGFTPLDEGDYHKSLITTGDTLFVHQDKLTYLKNNKSMFPVLSHA